MIREPICCIILSQIQSKKIASEIQPLSLTKEGQQFEQQFVALPQAPQFVALLLHFDGEFHHTDPAIDV